MNSNARVSMTRGVRPRTLALAISMAMAGVAAGHAVPTTANSIPAWSNDAGRPFATKWVDRGAPAVVVTNCNDAGPGSLRAAIESLASGGVVDLTGLTCSQITLTSGAIELPLASADDQNISLNGPGADQLTISGNDASPVFVQEEDEFSRMLVINGLSIVDGFNDTGLGGCISTPLDDVLLNNSRVTGCHSEGAFAVGGGLFASGVGCYNSELSGNTASGSKYAAGGGAAARYIIYANYTHVRDNTVIARKDELGSGNARGGGLLAKYYANLYSGSITGNTVRSESGNIDSVALGGGLAAPYAGLFAVRVSSNSVEADAGHALGGGIGHMPPSSTILDAAVVSGDRRTSGVSGLRNRGGATFGAAYSEISGNQAQVGGGIHFAGNIDSTPAHSLSLRHTTISGNVASTGGGGINVGSGNVGFEGLTITDNHAPQGGGIWIDTSPAHVPTWEMVSTIVADNDGEDIHSSLGATFTGGHNLVRNWSTSAVSLPGDTLTTDPLLLPLAWNGGRTRTHALSPGSPAINAGLDTSDDTYDQRGPGYPRMDGVASDIGAFEYGDVIFNDGFGFYKATLLVRDEHE